MRSSKSRSRSKSNRQRPYGNIVNRVFDSSGPEGKVRGTPQQVIDKYTQLTRDAQLGNDRVAAENFQQHAEHYTRLLAEAQREQETRRDQQEQNGRDRSREGDGQDGDGQDGGQDGGEQNADTGAPDRGEGPQPETGGAMAMAGDGDGDDSTLVETPESKPAPKKRGGRKPRAKTGGDDGADGAGGGGDTSASAAE